MQKIVPSIWSAGTAERQAELYTQAFGARVTGSQNYPQELPEPRQALAGQVMTIDLEVRDYALNIINADDTYAPNPSVSFMVNFDPSVSSTAREELAAAHSTLLEAGGRELMPLGSYDFSDFYAWVEDPYGVSWQLMLTNPAGEPRPGLLPALMFTRGNSTRDFTGKLLELFPGSKRGVEILVPGSQNQVLFSDALIAGNWMMISDGGTGHDFTFSGGVSFLVFVQDQEELDRVWAALSAVPEAEHCGWCLDEYGISWQVLPRNLGELLAVPGAHSRLMQMGKIDIAALAGQ